MTKKRQHRSIGFQFENAIDSAFGKEGKGGYDKHSMRKSGIDTTDKVFSYKERTSLKKIGYQVDRFLKENYPEVKNVSEIDSTMIQHFLNEKANTNNTNSLTTIKSTLNKLDKVSSARYKSKESSFFEGVVTPKTTCPNNVRRNVNTTDDDWEKIKQAMEGSRSKANVLIELAAEYGLRVESLTNLRVSDFDFDNEVISIIDDKGKRDRVIPMTNPEVCKRACGTLPKDSRITKLLPSSVGKQFQRLAKKAGVGDKFKDSKSSIHSLRKSASCRKAKEMKERGEDRETILSEVSKWLGHGTSRRDVLTKYLDKETLDFISK